jgi:hypothetical protein
MRCAVEALVAVSHGEIQQAGLGWAWAAPSRGASQDKSSAAIIRMTFTLPLWVPPTLGHRVMHLG